MENYFIKQSEPGCSMKTAIGNTFKYYARFSGRSSRSEYWFWALFNLLVSIPFYIFCFIGAANVDKYRYYYDAEGYLQSERYTDGTAYGVMMVAGAILLVWTLITFLPNLALFVRRLHDTDKSGWWYFIAFVPIIGEIVLLVFTLQKTDHYINQYGGVKNRDYSCKTRPQDHVPSSQPHVTGIETHKQYLYENVDIASELEKYGKLLQQGLLNQEEFDKLKKRLLNL